MRPYRARDAAPARLSERDIAVLRSVSEHRFLKATQVEALHFSDHHSREAGARVCRRVLERLARDGFLKRLQRRVGGVRAGSASFIYALGARGRRAIGQDRRTTEPSELFLDHTLAIGDVHVELVRAERAGLTRLKRVEIEPACWRRFIGDGGAAEFVRPDLYLISVDDDYEDAWFLEVDCGTESPAAISRKCHAYQRYWRSGREQMQTGAFPLTLWVCPSEKRAARVWRVITDARHLTRELFRVTTPERLADLIGEGAG